jgi:hypothetical protein
MDGRCKGVNKTGDHCKRKTKEQFCYAHKKPTNDKTVVHKKPTNDKTVVHKKPTNDKTVVHKKPTNDKTVVHKKPTNDKTVVHPVELFLRNSKDHTKFYTLFMSTKHTDLDIVDTLYAPTDEAFDQLETMRLGDKVVGDHISYNSLPEPGDNVFWTPGGTVVSIGHIKLFGKHGEENIRAFNLNTGGKYADSMMNVVKQANGRHLYKVMNIMMNILKDVSTSKDNVDPVKNPVFSIFHGMVEKLGFNVIESETKPSNDQLRSLVPRRNGSVEKVLEGFLVTQQIVNCFNDGLYNVLLKHTNDQMIAAQMALAKTLLPPESYSDILLAYDAYYLVTYQLVVRRLVDVNDKFWMKTIQSQQLGIRESVEEMKQVVSHFLGDDIVEKQPQTTMTGKIFSYFRS